MKFTVTRGCLCDGIDIDGKDIQYLSKDEISVALETFCDYLKKKGDLSTLLETLVPIYCDDYRDLGHCDQCGDYIEEFTINSL